jgi:YesN/AraC family two-component response regulator
MYGIKFKTSEEQKKNNLINRKQKGVEFEAGFSERFSIFLTELRESKQFLDTNFSIQYIADSLQTSPHKVRKYLEIELNSNFSQVKNQLRIQHFLDVVKPSDFEKYNLSGLIKPYGFTNTSQFRELFDKYAPEKFDSFLAKMKNNG